MMLGNVPRVDGQLAMTRAFGDGRLKDHITSEPDVMIEKIDADTQFMILASDGLWKVFLMILPLVASSFPHNYGNTTRRVHIKPLEMHSYVPFTGNTKTLVTCDLRLCDGVHDTISF